MDSSDVLILLSFDNLGMLLVSNPFNVMGYGSWRRSMEIALTAKNQIGFVNGACKKPDLDSVDL